MLMYYMYVTEYVSMNAYNVDTEATELVLSYEDRGAKQGGVGGGVATPPEFWMGGLNTSQPPPPPDFEKNFIRGGGLAPLKLI